MQIDPSTQSPGSMYGLLIQCITPRPIAWISTVSPGGATNLAPFSFYNGVGANPPTLMFSCANRRDGSKKDTLRNVEATREFVVNASSFDQRRAINASSAELEFEVSEIEECGLATLASHVVTAPRIAESRVHFECRLNRIVRIGEGPLSANLVIGNIVMMHVDDALLRPDGSVDPAALDTIGRMGGTGYCRTREMFFLDRPGRRGGSEG